MAFKKVLRRKAEAKGEPTLILDDHRRARGGAANKKPTQVPNLEKNAPCFLEKKQAVARIQDIRFIPQSLHRSHSFGKISKEMQPASISYGLKSPAFSRTMMWKPQLTR